MPLLVKIDNKRLWDKPGWLPAGEVPADAIRGFRVDEGELSVWFVEADGSNLDRVLTALAANRDLVDKLDYATFAEDVLHRCGITMRPTQGKLPDEHANQTWHRDLVELTGRKLVALAESIATETPARKSVAAVKALLADAAKNGRIRRELVSEKLAATLEWPESPPAGA